MPHRTSNEVLGTPSAKTSQCVVLVAGAPTRRRKPSGTRVLASTAHIQSCKSDGKACLTPKRMPARQGPTTIWL